jgi:hypothetical protein
VGRVYSQISMDFKEMKPGSSVSIVVSYGLNDRPIEVSSPADAKRMFPLASMSRQALGPTQLPVQLVREILSPRVKRGQGGGR